jgi:hypothetical protein
MTVPERLAFRCAVRGGECDCIAERCTCRLDAALEVEAPACERCGRPTRLEDRFRLDHEQTDGPGLTLQLIETRNTVEQSGVDMWGAEVRVFYCEPCDVAEMHFLQEDEP